MLTLILILGGGAVFIGAGTLIIFNCDKSYYMKRDDEDS